MSPFAFLLVAVVLIAVGLVVVLIRNHQPRSKDHAIDEFQKEMRALSPESRRATDQRLRPMPRERGGTGE